MCLPDKRPKAAKHLAHLRHSRMPSWTVMISEVSLGVGSKFCWAYCGSTAGTITATFQPLKSRRRNGALVVQQRSPKPCRFCKSEISSSKQERGYSSTPVGAVPSMRLPGTPSTSAAVSSRLPRQPHRCAAFHWSESKNPLQKLNRHALKNEAMASVSQLIFPAVALKSEPMEVGNLLQKLNSSLYLPWHRPEYLPVYCYARAQSALTNPCNVTCNTPETLRVGLIGRLVSQAKTLGGWHESPSL